MLVLAECEGLRILDIRRTALTKVKREGRRPQDFRLHRTEREATAQTLLDKFGYFNEHEFFDIAQGIEASEDFKEIL